MSTQRFVSTSFWDDPWVTTLNKDEKLLYLYLLTSPLTNIAGVYQISIKRMSFDTTLSVEEIKKILTVFKEAGKAYFYDNQIIVLPKWPKHQKWREKKKIEIGIVAILKTLSPEILSFLKNIGYTYPIDTISISYTYQPSYSDPDPDPDPNSDRDIDTDIDFDMLRTSAEAPLQLVKSDKPITKDEDKEFYNKIQKMFIDDQPGNRFKDYGKEGSAIKALIKESRARAPDDPEGFLMSMIIMFKRLRQTDKFFGKQPFTPSALNSAGIFDRVLTEGEREWNENREAGKNYEEILF